jgi:hypothetical protein
LAGLFDCVFINDDKERAYKQLEEVALKCVADEPL